MPKKSKNKPNKFLDGQSPSVDEKTECKLSRRDDIETQLFNIANGISYCRENLRDGQVSNLRSDLSAMRNQIDAALRNWWTVEECEADAAKWLEQLKARGNVDNHNQD